MNGTTLQTRREYWRQLITEQENSGKSVRTFCREKDVSEFSFYTWRRRLRTEQPVTFALVDTTGSAAPAMIEMVLTSGDRLRILSDAATLRMVLSVVRERA
jgi:transposase-like protein